MLRPESEAEDIEVLLHANRQREKTYWQRGMEARRLWDIESKRAVERMQQGGRSKGQEAVPDPGQVRDKVGRAIGLSGRSVDTLLDVVGTVISLQRSGDVDTAETLLTSLKKGIAPAAKHSAVQAFREARRQPESETDHDEYIGLAAWEAMSVPERVHALTQTTSGTKLNRQIGTSIEWAQWSWNPVTGCRHGCEFCYARDIANHYFPQKFEPVLLPGRLGAPAATDVPMEAASDIRHKNVFTCSMADLFGRWVPQEWIDRVLDVIRTQNQWNYLLLTKFPQRLAEQDWPSNAWVGTTVNRQADILRATKAFEKVRKAGSATVTWLSVEPLIEPLKFDSLALFDWIVIGGASKSARTPKWVPPRRWVEDIIDVAEGDGCRVYMKTNLEYRRIELPGWSEPEADEAPVAFFPERKVRDG